jgi:hypothetical protein
MLPASPHIQIFFEERVRLKLVSDPATSALEFFADVDTLGRCDFFIGQFASSVARLGYQLIAARKGRHVPFVSVEMPWARQGGGIN